MPKFETSVTLACPRERAFDFLLRPANVARIAPPEQMRLVTSVTAGATTLSLSEPLPAAVERLGKDAGVAA